MGIFGALTNAVTGLRAQAYALENISGNIANSQTTGFKRIDTSFQDLIPDTPNNRQLAGSVSAMSRNTNTVQGDIQNASIGTFMAVNGDGFFVVQKPASFVDNKPVFDGINLFTRRGDFQADKNGFLVNGAGYYLMGVPVDPATGNPAGSVPTPLQFQNDFLPAQPTTSIEYRANLASYPLTANADKAVPKSELLNTTAFTQNPLVAGSGAVIGSDLDTFIGQSISGGAVTAYDTSGSAVNLQLRWAKTDAAAYSTAGTYTAGAAFSATTLTDAGDNIVFNLTVDGTTTGVTITQADVTGAGNGDSTIDNAAEFGAILSAKGITGVTVSLVGGNLRLTSNTTGASSNVSVSGYTVNDTGAVNMTGSTGLQAAGTAVAGVPHVDTWEMFYLENGSATGGTPAWRNAGQVYSFGADGQQLPPATANVTLSNVTINGIALGNITIAHGTTGLTEFSDANGAAKVNVLTQNGFPAGDLQTVAVTDKGRLAGTYSNGRTIDLAAITLANFNGPEKLKRIDGGGFEATEDSGPALYANGGNIVSGALEGSNTDIGDEFTKLIVTQQAYSANTRVVTTSNEMVQDLLNMLR